MRLIYRFLHRLRCAVFGHNIVLIHSDASFHDTLCLKCGAAKSYRVGRMQ